MNGVMFIFAFFLMPETLFDRPQDDSTDKEVLAHNEKYDTQVEVSVVGSVYEPPPFTFKDYMHRMWFWDLDRPASRRMKATDFVVKPLSMLKYPSVAFPALY